MKIYSLKKTQHFDTLTNSKHVKKRKIIKNHLARTRTWWPFPQKLEDHPTLLFITLDFMHVKI